MRNLVRGFLYLFIVLAAGFAGAQTATTSLRGAIKDPGGALVPGAKVTITSTANGQSFSTESDSSGNYTFPQIPPAKYTITATSAGFGAQTKTAELLVSQPATVDFTMSIQSETVTVDVSTEAQTLNTTDASLGNAVGTAEIQALPSETRNVPDLLSLQPGVLYLPSTTTSDSRSGSVNGGRSDQGNVTLDGVDNNDQVGGFAFTGVLRATQDSVQEFRVTTGGSNADAGRSSGAQVSMVTKAGTNSFHGAAYEYHRPTFTVANDWFNKQAQLSSGHKNIPGKLIRNIFGADLGGPIKRDRLFFFGNYEGTRQAENVQVNQTVPTALYQQGFLQYQGNDPSGKVVDVTLSPAEVAQIDAGCQACNTPAYPNPPGPNPNSLAYFKSMPAANGGLLGDGLNTGSYSFSSPRPINLNTSIVRLDYILSDRHRLFVRGNLQDDVIRDAEQFPGLPASSVQQDNSKGVTAGYTWTATTSLVNDLRYGYVRQGNSNHGQGKGDYVDFRFLSTPTAETRTTMLTVPVNNVVDNLSWTKGNHSMQFGGNWRLIHQNRSSNATSNNGGTTNPYWLGGNPPNPPGLPVDSGFVNSYLIAYANLVGTTPEVTNVYNYQATSPTSGTLLADGAFLDRHFISNEFEWYAMDSWRVRPNLTITYGVRHTLLQTPYESHGQQVAPTIDTHAWFEQREKSALQGQIYEPELAFAPSGKFYNKPSFWPKQKNNFAPRLAVVWSPHPTTSIRAGAGIYYDHFGEGLVNAFDQSGSFGLNSQVSNPAGQYTTDSAPRFVGRNTLPNIASNPAPQNIAFPYLAPQGNFAITWGLDNKIKTPYSEAFDFSIQQQIGAGFTVEAAYVGRLGRHLLQELDLAEPTNFVDPKGGGDYYAAATQLSKLVDQNKGSSKATVPAIPYFENIFPFMAGLDYPGESATQAIYTNEWAPYRANLGATTALADLDFFCVYLSSADCASYKPKFWQDQFSSLYALSSIGMSSYHSLQAIVRHPTSHGLTLDFSVTWSHSIDYGSDTERSTEFGSTGANTRAFSEILNTWKPYLNRGSSDFDTRILITTDWVYQLPFGTGKAIAGSSGRAMDSLIGGWQWSGIERWSTGLPFSVYEPGWSTNWQQEGWGVLTAPVPTKKRYDHNGNPQYFSNPGDLNRGVASGGPIRLPYPGEAGQRNVFRGDGYFDVDSGLSKSWKLHEQQILRFSWEVYNVTNTVRFDPASIGSQLTQSNLGVASSLLTVPRRMQFSLRYEF